MRDAARRGALGIHPGGRRGGELQTLPGVTGRCSCSSVTENLEAAGSRSRVWVEKLRSAASKSRMCVLTAVISLKERNNTTTSKCGGGEGEVRSGAFLCALAVFWCAGPRAPYMVTAEGECEAEGSALLSLRQTSTAKLELCWEQRRNAASESHLWGEGGSPRAEGICLT